MTASVPMVAFGFFGSQTSGFQRYIVSQVPEEYAARVIDRDFEVEKRKPIWNAALNKATDNFEDSGVRKVLVLGDSLSGDLYVALAASGVEFPNSQFRRMRLDDRCMPILAKMLADNGTLQNDAVGKRCAKEASAVASSDLFGQADEIVLAANWQPTTVQSGIDLSLALAGPNKLVSLLGVAAFNDMA